MEARHTPRTVRSLPAAFAVVASLLAVGQALAVPRACCLPNGTCEIQSRSICEDQMGGESQAIGTDCSMVECPLLCGASAPACNGECPPSQVCIESLNDIGTLSAVGPLCSCVPEIPEGGACDPLASACAPGLACIDNVCAVPPAPAPALSSIGLGASVLGLLALGGVALYRRRAV